MSEAMAIEGTVDVHGARTPDIAGHKESAYAALDVFLKTRRGLVTVPPDAALDDEVLTALRQADAVAVAFPTFADGRGYTHARRLRDSGYTGTIVAYGDIGLDQLHYLWRSGCDRFALRQGTDLGKVEATFDRFKHQYVGVNTVAQDGA